MKKNLISVIILALTLANLVMNALLIFTVLPETKKANQLIDSVCKAIDLDLQNGDSAGISDVPIEKIATYPINGGETMPINLRSTDGKNHYAVLAISLSLNKDSENYTKYSPTVLAEYEDIMKNDIIQIVNQYTKEEFDANPQIVQDEILSDMRSMFGTDYIVGVNFSSKQTE